MKINKIRITICSLTATVVVCSAILQNNQIRVHPADLASLETEIYNIETTEVPLANAGYTNAVTTGGTNEALPSSGAPVTTGTTPVASGKEVQKNDKATIDYSNTADGYVMIAFTGSTTKQLKAMVTGPSGTKYSYELNSKGSYEVFPLSDGNGSYTVGVFENIEGTKYSQVISHGITVKLKNEYAPFLAPNQYVNYSSSSKTVAKAKELVSGKSTDIEKISSIYTFVVENLTYDKQKAQTVQSGYLPNLDTVLAQKKGICFDYAALMTAMIRSQGIPCKLVVGYAGEIYHAWINAYTKESGWVEQVVMFDGKTWKLMDPTFASSGGNSQGVLQYIGNASNYSAKYYY